MCIYRYMPEDFRNTESKTHAVKFRPVWCALNVNHIYGLCFDSHIDAMASRLAYIYVVRWYGE